MKARRSFSGGGKPGDDYGQGTHRGSLRYAISAHRAEYSPLAKAVPAGQEITGRNDGQKKRQRRLS
jgi:hypothetical protein